MKINCIIFITTTFLITSCAQNPINNERSHLLKSMLYTQRHLAELSLSESTADQLPRKHLLEQSYCDLINRQVVYTQTASQCHTGTIRPQSCLSHFHQCIGQCTSATRICNRCEQQAITCLTNTRLNHEKS